MKKIAITILITTLALFGITSEDIAKKSYETTSGFKSSISSIDLILINSSGSKSKRAFISKTLELEDGNRNLIEFIYPKDILGTRLLTYESLDENDKQWLYLSSIKRVKKIANSNKSSSFMGSEFSYEDIIRNHYKKYNYDNNFSIENKQYILTRFPKDSSSGYTKQIVYIDKDSFLLKKIEYFNRQNKLFKICFFDNYKSQNGIYTPYKIEMKNLITKKESLLITKSIENFANLNKRDFSKMVLGE